MDKTIEIMMVIAVTIVAAGIIIFLVQGEAGDFGDWADGQQESAQCELWLEQGDCDSFDDQECSKVLDGDPSCEPG